MGSNVHLLPDQTLEKKQSFISQVMTSKSPVRSCSDVDEEALSYAEIKALCAGNPLIAEKMNLDNEVARLKLLKGQFNSQRYTLQDDILKAFPERIEAAKGYIEGFKADIARLETNTHRTEEGISPMTIGGKTYTDRGEAGAALMAACKGIQTTQGQKIGSYRGFDMYVSYNILDKEFRCEMKGAMTHTTPLGNDSFGNITRINNAFDKIPDRLRSTEVQLTNHLAQLENAKEELTKPFAYEAEFNEKTARLVELDALLNMDAQRDTVSADRDGEEHVGNDGRPAIEPEDVVAKSKSRLLSDYVKAAADRNKTALAEKAAQKPVGTGMEEQNRKKPRETTR